MTDFFDSTGQRIPLGKLLGSGGEGAVHEVPAVGNHIVAKIYHHPLVPEKQAKLQGMVQHGSDELKKAAAWPLDTLHITPGGQIRGFLMPKLTDYEPIHHLYSPADRKRRYPDKDWAFLITVARNTAAAFEIVHGHKHVIGDVNPNSVFVAKNSVVAERSKVKLIDCDSFQTFIDGKHHLCEVGVPHFTPSELQNHSSFRGIHRTPNHDNFGLALLIFHLLLMGRHPFAGVFAENYDMPLEKSIAEFRYAFGRNAIAKAMSPPMNSVTTAILSPPIAQLFEIAFTEPGQQRPTAKHWRQELDIFRKQLSTCKQIGTHRYFNGLDNCTWCLHAQKFNHQFFIATFKSTASDFDLTVIWSKITAIVSPGAAPPFNRLSVDIRHIVPKPLPDAIKHAIDLIYAALNSEAVKTASSVKIAENELLVITNEPDKINERLEQAKLELESAKQKMDIANATLKKVTGIGATILAFFMKSKLQQRINAEKDSNQAKLIYTQAVENLRKITEAARAKQKLDKLREQEIQAWQTQTRQQLAILIKQERQRRSNIYDSEAKKYAELHQQFEKISTDESFQNVLKKLKELYEKYNNLLRKLELEHQHLQQNLPVTQLHKFLANKLLKDSSISGIGPNRQSILATHGIETALDIEETKIYGIKGFGKQLTNILLNWRKSMEQEFVFDPTRGIDPTDTAAINQRFASQLKLIEDQLLSGPEQLNKIRAQILQQRPQLLNELKQAVLKVAQAEADLRVFDNDRFFGRALH